MANNSPQSNKSKRVFCETGIDSDSDEERDVDVGIQLDNHGRATTNRHLLIEKTLLKRPKGAQMPPSLRTPIAASSSPPPKQTEKKKQVFELFSPLFRIIVLTCLL
jgi:hypothetical protein